MIWMGFTAMGLAAVLFMVWPLFARGKGAVVAQDGTSAVLIDQLEEVQRDRDRGVISSDEAFAARLEIKRRILTLSRKHTDAEVQSSREGRSSIYASALFVPLLAFGYYAINGAPSASNHAVSELQAARAQDTEMADIAQKLFVRLSDDPAGGPSDGWMLLGQTYMRMGQFNEAALAFDTVANREEATSATWSMLAEALIRAENGVVTPRAMTAIDKALEMSPTNPAASFYKAFAIGQAGNEAGAHDLLVSRLEAADGFAPWMESFVDEANQLGARIGRPALRLSEFAPMAAPGPSTADVAAAGEMTEEDRAGFIRSMVERLASRLEDEPDDLDGWMRLANAYSVLDKLRTRSPHTRKRASCLGIFRTTIRGAQRLSGHCQS
jgi:cytochrome c-type biogenesis protein CcmH